MNNSEYEILTEAAVPDYLRAHADLAHRVDPDTVNVREVGDGNLNLVFVCRDETGSSLVLKQSLPYVRSAGPSWPLTADRSHAEALGLTEGFRASPSTGAELFAYDPANHVLAMEDLSALTVWRTALAEGHIVPGAAASSGRHLARLMFWTSVLGLPPYSMRAQMARSTNSAMCRITEDLVFTEPYNDHSNNRFDDALRPYVEAIRTDPRLLDEVARLKFEYMTRTEALVHGDFHTGSVMVGLDDRGVAKAFDAEFCFYGPIAFDLGTLLGNLLFAFVRASCVGNDRQRDWLGGVPAELWTGYQDEVWELWPTRADTALTDAFAVDWLTRVARDTVGFAACEAIRRIVGYAKVSDIEALPVTLRPLCAAVVLDTARRWLTAPSAGWDAELFDQIDLDTIGRRGHALPQSSGCAGSTE